MRNRRGLLAGIVGFSLRHSGVVLALTGLLVAYGLYALARAKYDVFPEFAPPQVVIQTEAVGLSPEQVELLVTQPIENAIHGVPGIEALRSNSIQGLSIITVVFEPASDIYRDRQVLAERLATVAARLPQGVAAPALSPLTSSTSTVLVIGLTSERRSLMDVRTAADWVVKPRLLAVPGVAKVSVFGGDVRQFQVQIDPARLIQYGLTLEDVVAAARRVTGIRGAGFVDTANQRIVLRTEGQSRTSAEIAGSPLVQSGGPGGALSITLGDVAKIVEAPEPPVGAASVMGQPAVQLTVSEQYGANTLEVTERVERAMAELRPGLEAQGIRLHADLFRAANFIETATHNVAVALAIGAALVVVVLLLFLFNLRTAAISLIAIPLSLLAAIAVMEYFGLSLNTMTLGGLAIAIGLLVDDAVIAVENIYRRLRENRHVARPRPVLRVILDATLEVRSAVVYATLIIALVFLPVLTLPGVAGRLFGPLGLAYILATLASLVVALTVTPALSLLLLGRYHLPEREPPVVHWLKERYRGGLLRVERHGRKAIAGVVLLTLAGVAALPFFGGSFLPELKEGHFIIHMVMVPGTSLQESLRAGGRATEALLKLPFVRAVGQRVGRAEGADDTLGTHYSEFDVDLKSQDDEAESAQEKVRHALGEFPGVVFAAKTFLSERVEEVLSGYTASVVVNIYGNDLDALDAKAQKIAQALGQVRGATDVQVQSPPGTPQFVVRLRPEALARWGLEAVQVLDAVRTAYQGDVVGQVYDGNQVFNVAVILEPRLRHRMADIGALALRSPAGTYVRLRELADIRQTAGRYVVLHEGARRLQTITSNVKGRDVQSFVAEARQRVHETVALPPGSYAEFGGAAEAQTLSARDLLVHSAVVGIFIVLLLSLVVGNGRNLLLVLINLPFALVGGVLAVWLTGGEISIGSLVGFVTLFGITLRNSIMMLSHYEHLVAVEGVAWGLEAALRGAQERLAPILMTALVTALGLLPLALGSEAPGREIEGPMAVVILGGLATSTALNLLVLPMLALRFGRFGAVERVEAALQRDALRVKTLSKED